MNHILTTKQFTLKDISEIFKLADAFSTGNTFRFNPRQSIATLFYEPSTRTRISFEIAMQFLGGSVVSTENASQFSSAIKGETLEDTIKVISSYGTDNFGGKGVRCIVLRHSDPEAAEKASKVSKVPIINAGCGSAEHPTQALLDLYTIQKELVEVDGRHFCLVGDLKNGRTIHSLIHLLALYQDVKITLVSPKELSLPEELIKFIDVKVFDNLTDALDLLPDVVYMTRLQKERLDCTMFDEIFNSCVLDSKGISKLKKRCVVMHPLPRLAEIPVEFDKDPRAAYFRQAQNGLWVRCGLLGKVIL